MEVEESPNVMELDVSVIIINWNSARFLGPCLRSLYLHAAGISFEAIVVDNASYDGCDRLLASEFPTVRFIQSDKNLGFARANNLAARMAAGRVLLFLNSDTEVVGSAVEHLVKWIETLPDSGAIGPKLLNSDGSVQTTCVQPFPSILNQVFAAEYLRRTFPRWRLWGNRVIYHTTPNPERVEGVCGASLAIRRDVFESLGGFASGYFMYGEDMDLCYRATLTGRSNYYVGSASVIHHGGQSSSAASDKHWSAVVMRESIFAFMRANRGRWYAWLYRCATATVASCRIALVGAVRLFPATPERRRTLAHSASKWKRVLRWACGLERWAEQL